MKYFIALMMLFSFPAFAMTQTYNEKNTTITVSANESQFTIQLKSNPTTGYSWALRNYDKKLLTLVSHHFVPSKSQLIGAGGFETWTFRAMKVVFKKPQQTSIQLVYARPWEPDVNTKKVTFNVTFSPSTPRLQKQVQQAD